MTGRKPTRERNNYESQKAKQRLSRVAETPEQKDARRAAHRAYMQEWRVKWAIQEPYVKR